MVLLTEDKKDEMMSELKKIVIDTVATVQGIHDARDNESFISAEYHDDLVVAVYDISFSSSCGRKVCYLDEFISKIMSIDADKYMLYYLWKYLGNSIAEGIAVANF